MILQLKLKLELKTYLKKHDSSTKLLVASTKSINISISWSFSTFEVTRDF